MKQHTKRVGDKVGFWRTVKKGHGFQTVPTKGRIHSIKGDRVWVSFRGRLYERTAADLTHVTGKGG